MFFSNNQGTLLNFYNQALTKFKSLLMGSIETQKIVIFLD